MKNSDKYFILKAWKLTNWQGQLAWVNKFRIESGHIGLFMCEDYVIISLVVKRSSVFKGMLGVLWTIIMGYMI